MNVLALVKWIQTISRITMNRTNESFKLVQRVRTNAPYGFQIREFNPGSKNFHKFKLVQRVRTIFCITMNQINDTCITMNWIHKSFHTCAIWVFRQSSLSKCIESMNVSALVFRRITIIWLNKCSFTQEIDFFNSDNLVHHHSIPFHSFSFYSISITIHITLFHIDSSIISTSIQSFSRSISSISI